MSPSSWEEEENQPSDKMSEFPTWTNLDLILLFAWSRWEAGFSMIKMLVEVRSGPHHESEGPSLALCQGQLPGHAYSCIGLSTLKGPMPDGMPAVTTLRF